MNTISTHATISRGFTLIEMMVTCAILVLLLAVASPVMRNFIVENTRSTVIDKFATFLRLARSEALRRGSIVTVCIDRTKTDNECAHATESDAPNTLWSGGWFAVANTENPANPELVARETLENNRVSITSDKQILKYTSNGMLVSDGSGVKFEFAINNSSSQARVLCVDHLGRAVILPKGEISCT